MIIRAENNGKRVIIFYDDIEGIDDLISGLTAKGTGMLDSKAAFEKLFERLTSFCDKQSSQEPVQFRDDVHQVICELLAAPSLPTETLADSYILHKDREPAASGSTQGRQLLNDQHID